MQIKSYIYIYSKSLKFKYYFFVDANGDGVVANGNADASECNSSDEEWEEVKPRGAKGLVPRSVSNLPVRGCSSATLINLGQGVNLVSFNMRV